MKKTFKLVAIFMVATIGIFAGIIGVYFLIENNKTYYIYDLKIVNPNREFNYYVYTDNTKSYSRMKNQSVYMTTPSENYLEFGIYAFTSNGTTKVERITSDKNIADFYYENGRAYIKYTHAGVVDISVKLGSVEDKITLYVYDNTAESFSVYDEAYYGKEYSRYFPNKLVTYADDVTYNYVYEVSDLLSGTQTGNVDNNLLRVDESSVDKSIFSYAEISPNSRRLTLRAREYMVDKDGINYVDEEGNIVDKEQKVKINETVDTSIVIQSYYYYDRGSEETREIRVNKTFVVTIHVVADTPEYMQLLMSNSPDFDNNIVYVYTQYISKDGLNIEDTDKVEEMLSNQKEVTYLSNEREMETYNSFFSEKVNTIYFRFRKVYTNGYIEYLNPTKYENNPFSVKYYLFDRETGNYKKFVDEETGEEKDYAMLNIFGKNDFGEHSYFKINPNKNYYELVLDKAFFDENGKIMLELTLDDYYKLESKRFTFEYRSLKFYSTDSDEYNEQKLNEFYTYDENSKVYIYKYWDPRSHFYSEIYDGNGNIIDFGID